MEARGPGQMIFYALNGVLSSMTQETVGFIEHPKLQQRQLLGAFQKYGSS